MRRGMPRCVHGARGGEDIGMVVSRLASRDCPGLACNTCLRATIPTALPAFADESIVIFHAWRHGWCTPESEFYGCHSAMPAPSPGLNIDPAPRIHSAKTSSGGACQSPLNGTFQGGSVAVLGPRIPEKSGRFSVGGGWEELAFVRSTIFALDRIGIFFKNRPQLEGPWLHAMPLLQSRPWRFTGSCDTAYDHHTSPRRVTRRCSCARRAGLAGM